MASFFLAAKTSEYGEYRINDFVGGKGRSGKNLKIKKRTDTCIDKARVLIVYFL